MSFPLRWRLYWLFFCDAKVLRALEARFFVQAKEAAIPESTCSAPAARAVTVKVHQREEPMQDVMTYSQRNQEA
ncbi:hypothetical protein [Paraburkholderia sp. Cpub6]|uniref:hypothetical protein n=1 Tax=Paraburkholderia sp. Cpub6 TaxID=2723094 RepID=UPI0016121EE5|nr:hypothetical protein [Paraburkholderia sp. Cpub6]MBB5456382.1 hypothetical protein [Paraburkholderia sp. Cpub6]